MKTKPFYSFLPVTILVIALLFTTAALVQAKLSGAINFNNPYAKVTAMCDLSYVDFKADNGTVYKSSALARGLSEQSCTYKILNVPSGTKGVLRAKLTLYSQNTHIYTCWYSAKTITPTWLSGAFNITSGWSNHSDSLSGSGICKSIK